ncbi:Retrovirus-related Pol poly from transposon [Brachionus plicatilis]|uniref:Retrovirus-related Pol poly from transposon n=1 Tax=Brachionus plicatilis TaxID=10195 RepID=A0A3M7RSD5_BRAPC|nr:Retrovirus-related Pol poly from transposon [Brachionus plicatilis]
MSGYLGFDRTFEKLKQRFYWPNYRKELAEFINKCDICASAKTPKAYTRQSITPIVAKNKENIITRSDLIPAENVRYETIFDTTDANNIGKENLSTTKDSIHLANVSAPAPNAAAVQQKESTADPSAEEEANIEDSYWLDDQHLNLHMDDFGD